MKNAPTPRSAPMAHRHFHRCNQVEATLGVLARIRRHDQIDSPRSSKPRIENVRGKIPPNAKVERRGTGSLRWSDTATDRALYSRRVRSNAC
jgi:hypothetical protein